MNQRIKWIDYLKGFLILTVMFGHTLVPSKILKPYVYSFHMPLFFILSGYTMSIEKYSFKEFIIKKFKTLILPGFIFMIPITLCETYFLHLRTINSEAIFKGTLLQIRGNDVTIAWFLIILFVSEILLYIIINGIRNEKFTLVLITILSISDYIYLRLMRTPLKSKLLPYSMDIIGISMFFIYLGYFIKHRKIEIKKDRNLYMINFFIISILTCYLNYKKYGYHVDIYSCRFGNYLLFMISAISGSIGLIMLFKKIHKCKILEYIGKNSLIYYVFHGTFFGVFNKIVIDLKLQKYIFSKTFAVIYIVAGLILITPIIEAFKFIKSKKLNKIKEIQTMNSYVGKLEN